MKRKTQHLERSKFKHLKLKTFTSSRLDSPNTRFDFSSDRKDDKSKEMQNSKKRNYLTQEAPPQEMKSIVRGVQSGKSQKIKQFDHTQQFLEKEKIFFQTIFGRTSWHIIEKWLFKEDKQQSNHHPSFKSLHQLQDQREKEKLDVICGLRNLVLNLNFLLKIQNKNQIQKQGEEAEETKGKEEKEEKEKKKNVSEFAFHFFQMRKVQNGVLRNRILLANISRLDSILVRHLPIPFYLSIYLTKEEEAKWLQANPIQEVNQFKEVNELETYFLVTFYRLMGIDLFLFWLNYCRSFQLDKMDVRFTVPTETIIKINGYRIMDLENKYWRTISSNAYFEKGKLREAFWNNIFFVCEWILKNRDELALSSKVVNYWQKLEISCQINIPKKRKTENTVLIDIQQGQIPQKGPQLQPENSQLQSERLQLQQQTRECQSQTTKSMSSDQFLTDSKLPVKLEINHHSEQSQQLSSLSTPIQKKNCNPLDIFENAKNIKLSPSVFYIHSKNRCV